MEKQRLTPRQARLRAAEEVLRDEITRKYPGIALIVEDAARSGLYGTSLTFLEATIELVAEQGRQLVASKHPLIAVSTERLRKRARRQRMR